MKRSIKKANKAKYKQFGNKYMRRHKSRARRAREKAVEDANTPKMPGPVRAANPGSFEYFFGITRHPYKHRNLTESFSFGYVHEPEDTLPGMCPCFSDQSCNQVKDRFTAVWPDSDFKVRRVKMECPHCKRRVIGRITFCHDGDCMIFLLPVHKPKGWWKDKKKRLMRDKECRRGR